MTVTCVLLSYRRLYITLRCQTVTHTLTSQAWASKNLHRPHRKITELLERYRKDTKFSLSDLITYGRYQGFSKLFSLIVSYRKYTDKEKIFYICFFVDTESKCSLICIEVKLHCSDRFSEFI